LGLNTEGHAGNHVKPATAGSPIDILLNEFGLHAPKEAYQKPEEVKQNWADWLIYDRKGKGKPKGRSTLHKWVCPDCGLAVRIGINSDPHLMHDVCSEIKGEKVFLVKHDGLKHTIYESAEEGEKPKKDTPQIIDQINSSLKKPMPGNSYFPTVESIARKFGVNERTLYEWVKNDPEFAEALERLKKAQENDPFKTGTDEDTYVSAMLVTFLLLETRNRHFKAGSS
jgi:transposase-like protein